MMKTNYWFYSAIAGAALATFSSSQSASAQTTNLISNTTYEQAIYDDGGMLVTPDGRPRWTWGYNYSWGWADGQAPGVNASQDTFWMEPVDNPTNTVARTTFDVAAYANPPAGAGFGMGFGGALNWNLLDPNTVWPTNRQHYVLSFDIKAEGLAPGRNEINVEMQTQLDAPDDVVAADSNTDADRILQVNHNVAVSSNWTHYSYTLDDGSVGGGSEENLVKYASQISAIAYNVNIHQPNEGFDWDSENYIYLDNVKLQVINSTNPPPAPAPLEAFTISQWNFDNQDIWYSYQYGYAAAGSNPGAGSDYHAPGYGAGGSNAWILRATNTLWNTETKPAWAGVGSGGGGPAETSLFTTPDLTKYRITFDSRVHGLAPEVTSTTLRLQLFLRVPDDTLTPADGNTGEDELIRLDFNVPGSTNWATTSYLLSQGSVAAGSKANVTNHFSKIVDWRPQWQIENITAQDIWGYDEDNVLVIDNVKLERLIPAAPRPTISRSANEIVVSWPAPEGGKVKLQQSTNLTGPFTDVPTLSNPYRTPITGGQRFFRTIWEP